MHTQAAQHQGPVYGAVVDPRKVQRAKTKVMHLENVKSERTLEKVSLNVFSLMVEETKTKMMFNDEDKISRAEFEEHYTGFHFNFSVCAGKVPPPIWGGDCSP